MIKIVFRNPRVGHPAKEGLRLVTSSCTSTIGRPRVGHPAKEGLRPLKERPDTNVFICPEWVIQQKRD